MPSIEALSIPGLFYEHFPADASRSIDCGPECSTREHLSVWSPNRCAAYVFDIAHASRARSSNDAVPRDESLRSRVFDWDEKGLHQTPSAISLCSCLNRLTNRELAYRRRARSAPGFFVRQRVHDRSVLNACAPSLAHRTRFGVCSSRTNTSKKTLVHRATPRARLHAQGHAAFAAGPFNARPSMIGVIAWTSRWSSATITHAGHFEDRADADH